MKIIRQLHGGGSSAGTFLAEDKKGREVVMKFSNWSGIGSNGVPWLKAQFDRLKELKKQLPTIGASTIPEVYNYSENSDGVFYTLQYYKEGTPLSLYHLDSTEEESESFINDLNNLLTLMSDQFYSQGKLEVPNNYLERTHISRLNYRLELLYKKEGEVYEKLIKGIFVEINDNDYCEIENLFDEIWRLDNILINNKSYLNARVLLEKFEKTPHLLDKLKPQFLPKFAHGDALLRNFMKMPDGTLNIFDVRGVELPDNSPARIDITYELGKFLHGILLEIVRNDLFSLDIKKEKGLIKFQLQYDLNHKGVVKFLEVRKKMPKLFKNNPSLNKVLLDEPDWLQKAFFSEASHFLADAVNRLENDSSGKHAIAYYLIGTILLNEYLQECGEII